MSTSSGQRSILSSKTAFEATSSAGFSQTIAIAASFESLLFVSISIFLASDVSKPWRKTRGVFKTICPSTGSLSINTEDRNLSVGSILLFWLSNSVCGDVDIIWPSSCGSSEQIFIMETTFGRKLSVKLRPMTAGADLTILPTDVSDIPSSSRKKCSFGRNVELTPYCNKEGCFITASFTSSTDMPASFVKKSNLSSKPDFPIPMIEGMRNIIFLSSALDRTNLL
mmetsp:Transcript_28901/g.61579  ORF Transcript_28901/g.61579 Transcript_28901/m.61579 type:complete len:225 (+) Transcript_28901:1099-1773(+)